jgi:hypothetical protein
MNSQKILKKIKSTIMRKIYFLLLTVLFAAITNAQLTGTKNIPGDYATLDAAITDLNTQGVGAGGVILNLLAGNPQTAPAGGYAITATGTLANPITIQGNGNTITASSALVAGNLNDAIFKIIGGDYITLQGFLMQEHPSNTTTAAATNNMTEWGVALLYATTTDGAQNNTIQNNTISLNRTYSNTFGIYSNVRHSATDVITTAEATTASGSNSGNKIYGNAISNVNYGMVFIGSSIAAAMDNMNDIGGSSLPTGNTITNWGGWVSGAPSGYNSLVAACAGMTMVHQINENVSFNTLASATNITTLTTTGFIGIHKGYFFGQPSGTITADYNNNTVTLTNAPTTSQMTNIGLQGLLPLSTATFNCNNNLIVNSANTGASATSSIMIGMLHSAAPGTFNVNNNTIRGFSTTSTTGGFIGIQHQTNATVNALNINNNSIGDGTAGAITFANATAQSGTVTGIAVLSTAATTTTTLSISNNDFRGIVHTALGSGANTYITNASTAVSQTISNNTFTNLSINSTGSVTFISNSNSLPANGVKNVNNNNVVTGFAKTGAGGTITFFTDGSSDPATATNNTTNNTFSNITITGATGVTGISNNNGGAPIKNVIGNTVSNISGGTTGTVTAMSINFDAGTTTVTSNTINNITNGGPINGILFGTSGTNGTTNASLNTVHTLTGTGTGAVTGITLGGVNTTTRNLFRNKIYNLQNTNAAGAVNGVLISSGGLAHNVYNNLIGDLRTPAVSAANALNGINITSVTTLANINVSFNTIYLNGTSTGTNFGSSGIFHTTSATATTANLTLRNNIIVNKSTPNGTGLTVAYRRSTTTLTNFNNASDRNLFYAGTPSASMLIFYDGTNADQTLAAYQARVAPRDANSVTEDPPFLSTTGSSADFLHINAAIPTQAQGGASPISGILDDYDGDFRHPSTPDIGADEFTTCTGAVGGTATGPGVQCGPGSPVITASGFSTGAGSTYQWIFSTNSADYPASGTPIAGQTNPSTLNPGVISTTTYFWLRVTCPTGTATDYSNLVTVSFFPAPAASINASSTNICPGESVTLTENGGTATSWLWSPGGATTQSIIVSPTVTTTYSVTATSPGPCPAVANVVINVKPGPVITSITATPQTVCAGQNSQLQANVNFPFNDISIYSLTNLTGMTYSTLTGPGITVINDNSGLSSSMSNNQDDGAVLVTLPFTFTYIGNTFTQMTMCTNGWVGAGNQLSVDAVNGRIGGNLFTSTIPNNTIAPWFKDMGANFGVGFPGSMRHGLIGPDVYAFQWDQAVGSGFSNTTANLISFQVNIYGPASSNPGRIQLIYGPTAGTVAFLAAIGIEDAVGGTGRYINALTGTGNSTVTSSAWPGNGNGYQFDPTLVSYLWSPATYLNDPTLTNPLASNIMSTVNYTFTASATNGCSVNDNITVTMLSPIVAETIVQPTTCVSTDGSITLNVSGGTGGVGPYTFAWTGPGVNPTSQNQTGLSVGNYSVDVTDVPSGCITTLNFALPGPGGCSVCPTIGSVTTNPSPEVCANENITFTASGLADMGVTYGITFKYSSSALPDPYVGGTVIGTVPNGSLGGGGTTATLTGSIPTAGSYFIYAILSPTPVDPGCRPSASVSLTVNPIPNGMVVTTPGSLQVIITGNGSWADEITWTLRNNLNNIILSGGPYGFNPPATPSATVPANNAPFTFFIEAQGTFNDNSCLWEVRCDGVIVASGCIRGTNNTTTCPNVGTLTVSNISGCGIFADQTICTGQSITPINFTGTVPGTVFNWTRDNTGTVTGTIGASGSGTISGTLINTTTAAITVTFTITPEANGCFGSPFTATVTVNPAPTVTCPANITTGNSPGLCGAIVNYPPATVTGTPTPTVTYSHPSGSVFPVGTTTVTVTATNSCGTATCTFTVTVNDTQPPTITCPSNITVNNAPNQCGAVVNFTVNATDNCPLAGATPVTLSQNTSTNIVAGSVSCNAGGIHTDNSYYRVFDLVPLGLSGPLTINQVRFGIESANAASGNQPVTVRLHTLSGAFTLANLTQIASQTYSIPNQTLSLYTATLSTPATVQPNATLVLEIFTPAGTGNSFFIGSNALGQSGPSYIMATACGVAQPTNLATIGFPNMHIVLQALGSVTPAGSGVTVVPASGSFFPVGTTTVTATATDAVGNTSSCSFTVTVVDNQPPAITCPANITVSTPIGSCTAVVNYNVTATDNCPGVTTALVSGPASGSAFPLGVTTVTWRATDAAGNTSTCSFTVTVNDAQIPVISSQPANANVCAGSNATFTVVAAPLGGPSNLTYQWQQWTGAAFTNIAGATNATLTIPNVTLAMNGNTYRVVINGLCTQIISGQATLNVRSLPNVSLSTSRSPSLTPGQLLTIMASVSPTGGTIAWYKDGVLIPGAVTLSLNNLTVDDVGTYHAVYTALNGCSATSGNVVVTKASSENVFIYPNPNDGRFQVRVYNQNEPVTITVYDSKGAMVYQRSTTTSVPYTRIDVDLSHVASGHYVVDVRGAGDSKLGSKQIVIWR